MMAASRGSNDVEPRGSLPANDLQAAIAELLSETEGFGDEQRAEIICSMIKRRGWPDLLDVALRVVLEDGDGYPLGTQLRRYAMNMRRDAGDARNPELIPYAESIEWFAERLEAHESIARAAIEKASAPPGLRGNDVAQAAARISRGLERFDDLGLVRIIAGRQGPGVMIDDLRTLLAAVTI